MSFVDSKMIWIAALVSFAVPTATHGQVDVSFWDFDVTAIDVTIADDTTNQEMSGPQPNPFSFQRTVTHTEGDSSNTTMFDFSAAGNFASFDFEFDHIRAGTRRSLATTDGAIRFTVSQDVEYLVEGMYSLSGTEEFSLGVSIIDVTNGFTTIFGNGQKSLSTPDEVFIVGLQEGDTQNTLIGSPMGTLFAGNEYQFGLSYSMRIPSSASMDDGGASATGFLNFTITPEPTSAIFLGLGGLALLHRTRRTRLPLDGGVFKGTS